MNKDILKFRVTAPCPVSWESMEGSSEKVRFCHQCSKNVHNISAMSSEEAVELLQRSDQRVCAFMYKRADGSFITHDCPEALKAFRKSISKLVSFAISVVVFLGIVPAGRLVAGNFGGLSGGGASPTEQELVQTARQSLWMALLWPAIFFKVVIPIADRFRILKSQLFLPAFVLPFFVGCMASYVIFGINSCNMRIEPSIWECLGAGFVVALPTLAVTVLVRATRSLE